MDDMQFAKYAADIREILEKTDQESLENLGVSITRSKAPVLHCYFYMIFHL